MFGSYNNIEVVKVFTFAKD